MTTPQFQQARQELLADMHEREMCQESIAAVRQANNLADLVRILHLFDIQLTGEDFPRVEWLRRWFDRYELATHGIYLDLTTVEIAPPSHILLFGNSLVTLHGNETRLVKVTAHQASQVRINALDFSMWTVELQQQATLAIIHQDQYSRINIRDKR